MADLAFDHLWDALLQINFYSNLSTRKYILLRRCPIYIFAERIVDTSKSIVSPVMKGKVW